LGGEEGGARWEESRRKFLNDRGMWVEGEGERGGEEETRLEEMVRWEREAQRAETWERIRESRYNKWYKEVKGEGIPEYLKKEWGESRWSRIARFRLGNEMREGRYWEEEEKGICRLCEEEETWEHTWERCRDWGEGEGSWQEARSWVLGEGERGNGG